MNLLKQEADISATRAQEAYTKLQQQRAEQLLPAELSQIEAGIKMPMPKLIKLTKMAKKLKSKLKTCPELVLLARIYLVKFSAT